MKEECVVANSTAVMLSDPSADGANRSDAKRAECVGVRIRRLSSRMLSAFIKPDRDKRVS